LVDDCNLLILLYFSSKPWSFEHVLVPCDQPAATRLTMLNNVNVRILLRTQCLMQRPYVSAHKCASRSARAGGAALPAIGELTFDVLAALAAAPALMRMFACGVTLEKLLPLVRNSPRTIAAMPSDSR
jgi:hypothetical protein